MKKVTKNVLRIISRKNAHLLTPVKFQRNRSETVGGVAYTMYLLLEGRRKDARKDDGRKTEYYVPSLFFETDRRFQPL